VRWIVERLKTPDTEQAELLQVAIDHPERRAAGVAELFGLKY